MTISRTGRLLAHYAAICASLMLAMSTSHAAKPSAVADDDLASANGGDGETVVHIDVLVNDSDPNNLIADLVVTTPPGFQGTAVRQGPDFDIAEPGSLDRIHVDYNIAPGFGGTETFTYDLVDKNGKTLDSATVTITVDGSTATTKAGAHKVVFGGAAFPDSDVPLSAAGELAKNDGTSTTQCCKVLDPRVSKGKGNTVTFDWSPFDLGAAMSSTPDCAAMPDVAPGTLIVPRHFSVHTQNLDSKDPNDYEFGVCVVDTTVEWDGPTQVDIVAKPVVGYEVDCKVNKRVDKQPLTLGLSMDPKEFTAPVMRPVTSECDPRGVTRWSTWYFVVNAVHLIEKENSRGYVASLFSVLKSMIEEMRKTGAADTTFLRDLKSIVLQADGPATPPGSSMAFLDNATIMALTPPEDYQNPYAPNGSFSNPKGELVSHLAALRYAVCSELAFPGELENCTMNEMVDAALPKLP